MFGNPKTFLQSENFKKELIRNKTFAFLFHVLREYGIMGDLMRSGMVACGIGDMKYEKLKGKKRRYCLFILHEREKCKQFIKKYESRSFFVDHYPADITKKSEFYFSVIEIPSKYHRAYNKFVEGKYSEMYEQDDIKRLGLLAPQHREVYAVLTKDPKHFAIFEKKVNECFGTEIKMDRNSVREYSLPPHFSQEVFFYQPNKKS